MNRRLKLKQRELERRRRIQRARERAADPRRRETAPEPTTVGVRMIEEERVVCLCMTPACETFRMTIAVAEQVRDAMTVTINHLKALDNGQDVDRMVRLQYQSNPGQAPQYGSGGASLPDGQPGLPELLQQHTAEADADAEVHGSGES